MKFKINASEFRNFIKIERSTEFIDEKGLSFEKWNLLFETKAKVANLKFEEFLIAQGQGLKDIKTFYIRYPKGFGVSIKDRIYHNSIYYNIISIDDIENRGMYLALKGEVTI